MMARKMLLVSIASIVVVVVLLLGGALISNNAPLLSPPGIWARLSLYLQHNVAQTGSDQLLPELSPIILQGEKDTLLQALAQALQALQWHDVVIDQHKARLSAVVTTPWLKFSDDISVQLLAIDGGRMELLVRASSRIGRGDLGANANHIMQLRAYLQRQGLVVNGAP